MGGRIERLLWVLGAAAIVLVALRILGDGENPAPVPEPEAKPKPEPVVERYKVPLMLNDKVR